MKTYTVGIVGGMGLAAGIELEKRILYELEQKILAEEHYPRIVAIHDTRIDDRSAYLLKRGPNPASQISQVMDILGSLGADLIAMPCNTAHSRSILDKISSEHRVKLVNIIDTVVEYIGKSVQKGGQIGVMATQGTYVSNLYCDALTKAGYRYIEPGKQSQRNIMEAIYQIKSEGVLEPTNQLLRDEFERLAGKCQVVILGCTELGLSSLVNEAKSIDSLSLLAKALVNQIPA